MILAFFLFLGIMTKQEIKELLTRDFFEDFARQCATIIKAEGAEETLFELLCDLVGRDKGRLALLGLYKSAEVNRAEFRAAYVFEYIYLSDPEFLETRVEEFTALFPQVKGESAKRHFSKIMAHLLGRIDNDKYHNQLEAVATSCVDWVINQKVRVAVVVWAVECLLTLKARYEWLPEILDEILDNLTENPTAGMKVRLKKWKFYRH